MTLTLSSEIEKALTLAAVELGKKPDEYALEVLAGHLTRAENNAEEAAKEEPTLAELFAGRTGLVDSEGKYNYSGHTGKAYSESLLKQRKQGQVAKTKEG